MHTHLLSPSGSIGVLVAILIFISISTCYSQEEEQYYECNRTNYSCGPSIQNITYPFWGDDRRPQFCGHQMFELKCHQDEYPTIDINNRTFRVLEINQTSNLMTIARPDFWDNHCPRELFNLTYDVNNLLRYSLEVRPLFIFYGCTHNNYSTYNNFSRALGNNFSCPDMDGNGKDSWGFYTDESFLRVQLRNLTESAGITCNSSVVVPVLRDALERLSTNLSTLQEALNQGFELVYYAENGACSGCEDSGGICGSDSNSSFVCHCHDHTDPRDCRRNNDILDVRAKLLVGFSVAGFTILLMSLLFFFYRRRIKKRFGASRNTSYTSSIKDLEKSGTYLKVQIFSYNELEKATSRFDSKTELGDGGFGTVYRGKLRDGRVVAVKRLYEHNFKMVEQFMNEVEILTRLRHQNLVSLYGCTTHHSRELLLVYEYIPNGTVADHLHGVQAKPGSLCWTTRMSIAIETASALSYLHASDVIHRDVKTNNILLDKNFCVKVADFGLSRLFPTNVSHVSTAPQGTPGYVDPEYHECYQLTDKSDVYSFGVVLVELISSKPAVDITRHRHEINLSNMAVNKIQNNALHELVDPHLGFGSDYKVRKMITRVAELAFQCLQNEKDSRPSMEDVLEVLKGIQSEDCAMKNAEVVDIPEDDIVLLKSDALSLSPDSVTVNWIGR